jgi:hypothetical protein
MCTLKRKKPHCYYGKGKGRGYYGDYGSYYDSYGCSGYGRYGGGYYGYQTLTIKCTYEKK